MEQHMHLKSIARPAAALLKAAVVTGLLATASLTTAHDANAGRRHHCSNGYVSYEGRCVPLGLKMAKIRKKKNAQQTPTCSATMPMTGQVVNMPCSGNSAPFTGKTCPFQTPGGGQVQVPC
jgi:hypothetical protein